MVKTHRHLHLNVQRTMHPEQVTQDMERAFALGAHTIGMCELETPWHHAEFRRCAKKYGYFAYLPSFGAKGYALGLAVKSTYGTIAATKTTFCAPGLRKVSPNRYLAQMDVQRHEDAEMVNVGEHHAYSSGWTTHNAMTALRKMRWHIGMRVVVAKERAAVSKAVVVIGAGDLNRPALTFTNGVLPALLNRKGMKTATYAHTDGTHGRSVYDYTWALSSRVVADFSAESTPGFNSDHDGILTELSWDSAYIPSSPK